MNIAHKRNRALGNGPYLAHLPLPLYPPYPGDKGTSVPSFFRCNCFPHPRVFLLVGLAAAFTPSHEVGPDEDESIALAALADQGLRQDSNAMATVGLVHRRRGRRLRRCFFSIPSQKGTENRFRACADILGVGGGEGDGMVEGGSRVRGRCNRKCARGSFVCDFRSSVGDRRSAVQLVTTPSDMTTPSSLSPLVVMAVSVSNNRSLETCRHEKPSRPSLQLASGFRNTPQKWTAVFSFRPVAMPHSPGDGSTWRPRFARQQIVWLRGRETGGLSLRSQADNYVEKRKRKFAVM